MKNILQILLEAEISFPEKISRGMFEFFVRVQSEIKEVV